MPQTTSGMWPPVPTHQPVQGDIYYDPLDNVYVSVLAVSNHRVFFQWNDFGDTKSWAWKHDFIHDFIYLDQPTSSN